MFCFQLQLANSKAVHVVFGGGKSEFNTVKVFTAHFLPRLPQQRSIFSGLCRLAGSRDLCRRAKSGNQKRCYGVVTCERSERFDGLCFLFACNFVS